MSKEVDDNKINISRELLKKQIFDAIILFVAFLAIYLCVKCLNFDGYDLIIILTITFIILLGLFEYSKSAVKAPLTDIIIKASKETVNEINVIQEKNKSQKENNAISDNKIKNTQELVENLKNYSDNMRVLTNSIQEKTNNSLDFTNNEYDSVKTNIEKMFSIRHKIQTIAELILELSDFVQSISSTVGLVEDIAEQTNLLALNAAVEAARAGEHGKGFAVVASEIRKLADESKQATTKIISLINDIQQTANSTVLATEEGTKEIESGLQLAQVISENIEKLIVSMKEISSDMNEIITSSEKINSDTVSAQEYVNEISNLVDSNRKITEETYDVYQRIESTTKNLKQSVL
jgi:methyl-accepting chemotaxis protein